ncbi:MAG: peptidoglycan-binding protein LysM [Marinobacter sp. 34-60-7]|nr:MAG: peptidoglycan-binding protein LysM [Marinobacter sp. 34-60-7]
MVNSLPKALTHLLLGALLTLLPALGHGEWSVARGSGTGAVSSVPTQTPEWVYTLRTGDSLRSVATELLTDRIGFGQLLEHNNLPGNAQLSAGDTLRIPLAWLKRQPEPAQVAAVSGNVHHISGADGRKVPLTNGAIIRVGDEILSSAGSATVELADGSEVRISPNTRLMFNSLTQYGKSGMVDTRLRLHRGEVHTRVKPTIDNGARFEIETPSAVAAVRGTIFAIQASANGSSVQVTEGTVDFGHPGQTRRIPAGYGASVSTNGAAGMSIRQLPPAPALNPVPPVLTRLPETLSWAAEQGRQYRLDLFDESTGAWVQSHRVSGPEFDISRLDNGRYELHLAALDRQGLAGMPASVSLEVDLQARKPTLLNPSEGESVDDDMPEFQWQLGGSNEVARVEISEDTDFGRLVATSEWAPDTSALPSRPLSPGRYYWRVVTEAGGNSVAQSDPRELVVNGTLPPVRIISVNYLDSQVRLFWERVDTASHYRLQLSEEPGFQNIVKEADVDETSAALRLIPGRRYFVRIKAQSDGPLASRWGPGRELFLD